MANEIRLRSNNISGTITDNPLAIGATTINSAGFADLPVVDATSHLMLILDPQEVGGTAEIVRVTAHTAAATSVTVQRGQESSSARSHVFNTTWMHGPVVSDFDQRAAGQLGYAQVTAIQSGITVLTDLTNLAVTVTVGASRRVRITGDILATRTVVDGTVVMYIREGTTTLQRGQAQPNRIGEGIVIGRSIVVTPSAGTHTYKLSLENTTGTGTVGLDAGVDRPAYILVEDIGAA